MEDEKKNKDQKMYVPYSITSFQQMDDVVQVQKQVQGMMEVTGMMSQMAFNILDNTEITDKAVALEKMTSEYITRLKSIAKGGDPQDDDEKRRTIIKALTPSIATKSDLPAEFAQIANDTQKQRRNRFWTVKSADGTYRWFAVWSNNFQDRDDPPDIISKAAHLDFIDRVQKGEADYPELWHFHQEGTKWGQSDMLAFIPLLDNPDVGFTIASGSVDKGKESHAEFFATQTELVVGVSHGMKEVVRVLDGNNNQIISRYTTYEISDLPLDLAANALTSFEMQ